MGSRPTNSSAHAPKGLTPFLEASRCEEIDGTFPWTSVKNARVSPLFQPRTHFRIPGNSFARGPLNPVGVEKMRGTRCCETRVLGTEINLRPRAPPGSLFAWKGWFARTIM